MSPRHLLELYPAQFKTTIAGQFQYRGALVIWLLNLVLEPVIYLVVWTTVARSQGGAVAGFSEDEFAAYFLAAMLVNHTNFTWVMWYFDFRIREGSLSLLLLRPVHPIHRDIAENLTFKLLTLAVLLPAMAGLILAFRPRFDPEPWALLAFLPAVALAFAVRFALEWTVALAAFWTTRVGAINQLYVVVIVFLSGWVAPLSLYPEPIQVLAAALPFRWLIAFPVELVLGRLSPAETLVGFAAQAAWLAVCVTLLRLVWQRGVRQYSAVGS